MTLDPLILRAKAADRLASRRREKLGLIQAYRQFSGRDPKIEALMKKRGFPVTAKGASGQ
jgi:hypothetical protein